MSKIILLLALFCWPLQAEEPWSVTPESPTIIDFRQKSSSHSHKGQNNLAFKFYKKYISSFDGPRCPLSPTCSAYCAQSLHQYGFFMGLIMTTDRLMHEGDKMNNLRLGLPQQQLQDWQIGPTTRDWYYAARLFQLRPYYKDSPTQNAFWWQK